MTDIENEKLHRLSCATNDDGDNSNSDQVFAVHMVGDRGDQVAILKIWEHKKSNGDNHESQLWLVLKIPLMLWGISLVIGLPLLGWWITGSPIGFFGAPILLGYLLVRQLKRNRKGTEQSRLDRIIREQAKKKQL